MLGVIPSEFSAQCNMLENVMRFIACSEVLFRLECWPRIDPLNQYLYLHCMTRINGYLESIVRLLRELYLSHRQAPCHTRFTPAKEEEQQQTLLHYAIAQLYKWLGSEFYRIARLVSCKD